MVSKSVTGNGTSTNNEHQQSSSSSSPTPALQSNSFTSSFTSEDNLCGGTLLDLVCRGHVIIANILQLSDQIPSSILAASNLDDLQMNANYLFNRGNASKMGTGHSSKKGVFGGLFGSMDKKNSSSGSNSSSRAEVAAAAIKNKYNSILYDFSYLTNPEEYDSHKVGIDYDTHDKDDKNNSAATTEAVSAAPIPIEQLEREFISTHAEILVRFHDLFQRVYTFHSDLSQFSIDLEKGFFVQYTVESVLLDTVGQQLLCEAVYLYGCMLLLIDLYIPGPVRERIIIAHYRYCGNDKTNMISQNRSNSFKPSSNLDQLCKLYRRTGGKQKKTVSTTKHPHKQEQETSPLIKEDLFTRLSLPSEVIRNVIGCLISNDIYVRAPSFPNYDHRSTRLSRQASMIFVTLFFEPTILKREEGKMREIVDKFFHDNWVLPLYDGMIVDLSIEWDKIRFPAAKLAMDNVLRVLNVQRLNRENATLVKDCTESLMMKYNHVYHRHHQSKEDISIANGSSTNSSIGRNGIGNETTLSLTEEFVLDNMNELLGCMRKANVALRWRLLHRMTMCDIFLSEICPSSDEMNSPITTTMNVTNYNTTANKTLKRDKNVNANEVVTLILLTSQFENELKDIFQQLLKNKEKIWTGCQARAAQKMTDLSDYFSGEQQALNKVDRNEGLMNWFNGMAYEIRSLTFQRKDEHFTVTGRKIQLCIQALEDVEQFDLVDRNAQVKAFLKDTRTTLFHMVSVVSIKDDICNRIDDISDFSYGRKIIETYVSVFHGRVMQDPKSVGLLRGLFLKMGSFLVAPIARLRQKRQSTELNLTQYYYANSMVAFVRSILDVIPISVFATLTKIVDIQDKSLMSLPQKIESSQLLQYSQLEERSKLAKITYELSVLTEGILGMEATMIGNMEINPRRLLEEGLRGELVKHISRALHQHLQFQSIHIKRRDSDERRKAECIQSFSTLARRMEGFRRGIEYIQDFIGVAGLKIYLEETARVIRFNTQREMIKYSNTKAKPATVETKYQSGAGPIPQFPRTNNDPLSLNFMGRTVNALLKLTNPESTIYSRKFNGWFLREGTVVCSIKMLSLLCKGIGIFGLSSLDMLLGSRCMNELNRFIKFYANTVRRHGAVLEQIRDGLFPEWKSPRDGSSLYRAAIKRTEKLMVPMMTCFCRVGQLQLLRKMIRSELCISARVDANKLCQSAETLNLALLDQLISKGRSLHNESYEMLGEVSDILRITGVGDPMETVFMNVDPLEGLPVLLTLFVIYSSPKFLFDSDFGALIRKEEDPIDGWPMVSGVATLLRQFHPSYTKSVLALLGQFVRCSIMTPQKQPKKDIPTHLAVELKNILIFMQHLCCIGNISSSSLFELVPQHLFEMYSTMKI